jgi:sulfatase modifying factor 1
VGVDAFQLAKYPLTNVEYRHYLKDTGSAAPDKINADDFDADNQPVVGVSWEDARAYCRWLNDKTGKCYRLPRYAEWEYAARGESEQTIFPWGDTLDPVKASFGGMAAPKPVGSYAPNGFGLFDMVGTVWEWCDDRYEEVSNHLPAIQKALSGDSSQNRVLRGGPFMTTNMLMLWIAYRHEDPPELCHESIGFRVAL